MSQYKPYKKYKPSGIAWLGDIPEHWEKWKISRGAKNIGSGTTPSSGNKEYYENGTINWLNTGDFNDGILYKCKRKVTSKAILENSALKLFPYGTLSVAMYGATIGKVCIIQFDATTNQACCNIEEGNAFLNKFLMYWFIGNKPHIVNLSYGGGQPNISQDVIKSLYVPCPKKSEQEKIANFLDYKTAKIDRFIRKKKQLIKLLNEQKAGIINDAVTGKMSDELLGVSDKRLGISDKLTTKNSPLTTKPSGIEWLGDIPEHWEVRKLKYVAECFPSNIDKHTRESEKQVRLCNYTDVYKNDFITNDMSLMLATASDEQILKFTLLKDDVIITKDSETANDIANPALVIEVLENVVCGYHLSVLRPNKNLIGSYLFRVLQVKTINIQFEICSNGVTRVGLGVYDLKKAKIPIPPLSEQQQIVSHIETETATINKTIATIEKEIALVEEYKTALIAEAVTGKIDVREYKVPENIEEENFEELEEDIELNEEYDDNPTTNYQLTTNH